jgi:hypothetical protein
VDTQLFINITLAIVGALGGGLIKVLWDGITELRTSDKNIVDRMHSIETLVAGTYIKREEFNRGMDFLSAKLDVINQNLIVRFDGLSSKLETKMDRGDCREMHARYKEGLIERRTNQN